MTASGAWTATGIQILHGFLEVTGTAAMLIGEMTGMVIKQGNTGKEMSENAADKKGVCRSI